MFGLVLNVLGIVQFVLGTQWGVPQEKCSNFEYNECSTTVFYFEWQ